jgi:thioredoxin reductase
MMDTNNFDVIIIGGSYSGLSAAMALGRSLRNVLIIDNGKPCNIQTPYSHNFITQDGKTPKEIITLAKQQVGKYDTVKFYTGLATVVTKKQNGFEVTIQIGNVFQTKKLIIATGIKDTMPFIEGFSACWGISVVHCPYCHGYELRNKKTAIYANGEKAFHLASLVNNLTNNITILTAGKASFKDEQFDQLNKYNIKIIETKIASIKHENGYIKNIVFDDDSSVKFEGMYGVIPFTQHSNIPFELGCETTEHGYIKVDIFQKTNITNVFACGDNSSMMRSLANAVHTGNIAAVMANMELIHDMQIAKE